ncbi:hypothetical protein COL516b_002723 [Colletotrichum fioriniae]|nr:uncharacterized protein COL516b_002723 [Colletotrichum fioriniae]KAJ0309478.1 hypothetical protein COL516b_002723 [Colletotrichum fioriniae]
MDIQISPATIDDIPEILELAKKARVDMYPHLDEQWRAMKAGQDLATFQKTFFNHPDGAFILDINTTTTGFPSSLYYPMASSKL